MRDVVWNERIKLGAVALNSVATASVGIGLLAPLGALVYGMGAVQANVSIGLAATFWMTGAFPAHGFAQGLLGRLRG